MSKSTPSLLALLGLVAVAGYQNRGRISEMMGDRSSGAPATSGGFLDEIGSMFGSGKGSLTGGLGDLVERFKAGGRGDTAESWVSDRANAPIAERDIEDVLGDDTIDELTQKTGLSRSELLQRLSQTLPEAVNSLTPDGRLPGDDGEVRLRPPASI